MKTASATKTKRSLALIPALLLVIMETGLARCSASPQLIYTNGFSSNAGSEWSVTNITSPTFGEKFLGPLGLQTVRLTLTNLLPHQRIRLSFDLYILGSWDGNDTQYGPDIWGCRVQGGTNFLRTTFAYSGGQKRQAYPGAYPGGDYPTGTGALLTNTLYGGDFIYRFLFEADHSSNSVAIEFYGENLQQIEDESWGLDNVSVHVFPSAPTITIPPALSNFIPAGETFTLQFAVGGLLPIQLQWRYNNTNINGATNSALILTNVGAGNSGFYSLYATNSFGSVTSAPVYLQVVSANGDEDGDGVDNITEFRIGTRIDHADTDGDGLSDYDELFVFGTNPLEKDTDGDGMPDGWEVQNGLNPRINDANDDADFDGLSNSQEYQYSLANTNTPFNPRNGYSRGLGLSDYEIFTGGQKTNRFFYDRTDRLVGEESSRGISLAYQYDGDGNPARYTVLSRAAETNGLPVLWRFLNGLTNNTSPYFDSDGDGWTDYQEWKAGSSPTNALSTPNLLGNPGINIASLVLPFTPSNFVVGVGQLDGIGAEEIVIGADGNPGTNTNFLLVLTETSSGWSTQRVDVGSFGITSIAVGQVTNRPSAAIYVGLRGTTNGSGRVMEFTSNGGFWQSNMVALSTNQAAFVLGVRGSDILISLATSNSPDGSLSAANFSTNWIVRPLLANVAHRGLGTVADLMANRTGFRLLDSGGVELTFAPPLPANATYWAGSGSAYFLTPTQSDWITAQSYAQQFGGNLVTIDSLAENNWLTTNFGVQAWIGFYRKTLADPYIWISGSPSTFTNWAAGEPQNFEFYTAIEANGQWRDYQVPLNIFPGIIEVPVRSLSEPSTAHTFNWRGSSLTSGFLRATNGSSIFYTFTDDKNANGLIDFGDDFVTAEYLVGGTNASLLTLSRQPIAALTLAQSYGLDSVNFLNASNEVFFTGEPDGQVFAWTATGTNPLQRQLFSAQNGGKAWHALAGVKRLGSGEGLIGLRVDPINQTRCDVILWPPQSVLPQTAGIVQTPPAAAVLPQTNILGSLAALRVRLWDAEGNASTPYLQYQFSGATNWQNATLTALDGAPYSSSNRVATLPTGVNHSLTWNVMGDLGGNVVTNVLLRARAQDFSLLGDWSPSTPFQINMNQDSNSNGIPDWWELQYFGNLSQTTNGDFDHDGVSNFVEYIADTNPTDPNSYPRISGAQRVPNGIRIDWQAGTQARQTLQTSLTLNPTNQVWLNVWTNQPPTSISSSYTDSLSTNGMRFYRIRFERP